MIYIPIYAREVLKTSAYKKLKSLYDTGIKIALVDFDGYNYWDEGYSMREVINNPKKKMGHAFVLAMLLEGIIYFDGENIKFNDEKGDMKKTNNLI